MPALINLTRIGEAIQSPLGVDSFANEPVILISVSFHFDLSSFPENSSKRACVFVGVIQTAMAKTEKVTEKK
jgi:hypothetical protein